jgi:hypothetical protein
LNWACFETGGKCFLVLATLDDQWSSHLLLQVILAAACGEDSALSEQVMPTSQHRQSCYARVRNNLQ